MTATTYGTERNPDLTDDPPFTVQDRRRKGFFTIDNAFYDGFGSVLGPYGLAVYMGLARYASQESECFPSQSTLAQRSGMSRMQVSREIEKLKELNLIAVEQQFGGNGAQRANLYILLDLPPVTDIDAPCNGQLHPPVTDSYTPYNGQLHPPVTDSYTPCNRQLHKQNIYNNTQEQQDLKEQQRPQHSGRDNVPAAKHDVVVVLTELGISESVAARLVQRYSRHRVLEKVAYLEFLRGIDPDKVQNPRGWLRRAIEENYGPPDGYLAPEEQERLDAAEKQKAREEAERARLAAEQTRGEQERIQSEQAVIARKLQDEYGTTVDDLAFWERAQWEIKYTASSDIADLMANARILKVKPDTIQIGVRYTDVWRRLQHPGTKKAITRVLMRVTDRPITLETILLS